MRAWLLFLLRFGFAWPSAAADNGSNVLLELGRSLASQGQYKEAITALERASRQAAVLGSEDGEALALNDLGVVYMKLHNLPAAERCLRRSVAIWGLHDDEHTLVARNNLAELYLYQRKYRSAETVMIEVESSARRNLGSDHPATAAVLVSLAKLAFDLKDNRRAAMLCLQALEVFRKSGNPDQILSVLESLGAIYRSQGKIGEAAEVFAQAREMLEGLHAPTHPGWILNLEDWGWIEFTRGRYVEAQEQFERALARAESVLGPDHPTVGRLLHEYAAVLRRSGRKSEAKKLMARATQIERQTARAEGVSYTVDFRALSGPH